MNGAETSSGGYALIGGTLLSSVASIYLARAAAAIDGVPRWAAITFGASGPPIGIRA